MYKHPPTPLATTSPLPWLDHASTSNSLSPTNTDANDGYVHQQQQQQPQRQRPQLKRAHAVSDSVGLASIHEEQHTYNFDQHDDNDNDIQPYKRKRVQAPSEEFALLSLAPGSPVSTPSSPVQRHRQWPTTLTSTTSSQQQHASLSLSAHELLQQQQQAPTSPCISNDNELPPLTAAHLGTLGLELSHQHGIDHLTTSVPAPPPPSAHSQQTADEELQDLTMGQPNQTSWEIAPNRIYIASLDSDDDDDDDDDNRSTKLTASSTTTSGTVTPTNAMQEDHDDDRTTTTRPSQFKLNSSLLKTQPFEISSNLPRDLFQTNQPNQLILYKPLSSFVKDSLTTSQKDQDDQIQQKDQELQEFRRRQAEVEHDHQVEDDSAMMELDMDRMSSRLLQFDQIAKDDARRFDDFETIDWIQDTLQQRQNRILHAQQDTRSIGHSTKAMFWRAVETGQSWFVVSLVGACIGLNAAFMSIITVWLSDLKLGYCSQGWWLNQKFCCWELEDECQDWKLWTSFGIIQWSIYAPLAAGSGISEIKCILTGFFIKDFLSFATMAIKSIALPIAIASGLSVGKEGPSVHVASAIGHVVANHFQRFKQSQSQFFPIGSLATRLRFCKIADVKLYFISLDCLIFGKGKMREIVTAAAAAGVAVAFGSPIGGVLFSLEEMTINYPIKTMWRSFFCALVATVVLSAMNPFRTGKLVLFQVHFDRDWHFFELGFFALIGIFGGLYGAFVIKYNLQVQAFRRKHLINHGIIEAVCLAVLTASIGFLNKFLRIDMNESLDILFRECEGGGDYENLCQTWAQWRMVNSLLLATVLRTVLVVISYGCKVPAGIFVPSMAVGATFGRMIGILVKALYRAHPTWSMFATCDPEKPCITPGTYAFLGAAAGLAGITRITVTVVVIMFELTGALTYILPTMIVVMVTKAVSDQFGGGGIADQMIKFNGFPLLEKDDHSFGVPVTHVMRREVVFLPSRGMTLSELETLIESTTYKGFPIVKSHQNLTIVGYVSRQQLIEGIDAAHGSSVVELDSTVVFCPQEQDLEMSNPSSSHIVTNQSEGVLDLTAYVNQTPITVSPKQPLEFALQLFKRMGPRILLIEQHGELVGLCTVKDCLRYEIAHEITHHQNQLNGVVGTAGLAEHELEQTLEDLTEWFKEVKDLVIGWFLPNQSRSVNHAQEMSTRQTGHVRSGSVALRENEEQDEDDDDESSQDETDRVYRRN
ncbi:glycerol ethanol, ferric requiring protein [Microbotryomycetes sp. JL221]|nr:glycerol ethanol, ferric requiring protein [Microbotryomycetes sp. JL221]